MEHVLRYCVYDAEACRLLWAKLNLLMQNAEVSRLSFTPLRCAFEKADGVKVRNMVAYNAFKRGFVCPMSSQSCDTRIEDKQTLERFEKYPGAYVPEPKKGVSMTPVIALDFASLYPSIIRAHNLSPENVIPLAIESYTYMEKEVLNDKSVRTIQRTHDQTQGSHLQNKTLIDKYAK